MLDEVTWRGAGPTECDQHGFFEGETESCINGQVATAGAPRGEAYLLERGPVDRARSPWVVAGPREPYPRPKRYRGSEGRMQAVIDWLLATDEPSIRFEVNPADIALVEVAVGSFPRRGERLQDAHVAYWNGKFDEQERAAGGCETRGLEAGREER